MYPSHPNEYSSGDSRQAVCPHHGGGILALLMLLPAWLGLLGGASWLLDLLAHFRWQYLVAGTVVLAWAIWRKRRKTMVLAALTVLLNGVLIGQLARSPEIGSATVAADFSLRVVSLNVRTSNRNTRAVLDYLDGADADVIFLMEVDQQWAAALQPLQAKYPHRIVQPRPDNFGVALFSRIPWSRGEVVNLGPAGLPSVEVALTHQGRELVLLGTHPLPPRGAALSAQRDRQLAALAEHVRQLPEPVLLVGDLNSTPWSRGMRIVTGGNLGFRSLVAPWTPTWRARSIFAIPIDHALCTAPLVIAARQVGPDVGSDHRPLLLSVGWLQRP